MLSEPLEINFGPKFYHMFPQYEIICFIKIVTLNKLMAIRKMGAKEI